MAPEEFSNLFDVLFNNITSNQAPGLTEYEKCIFLTKSLDETIKNHFLPLGNPKLAGFDDNLKRQADFSALMSTSVLDAETDLPDDGGLIDDRSKIYEFPEDVFIVINEALVDTSSTPSKHLQIIPLRYDEYTRLMSKPFKRPLKNQAWRLINSGSVDSNSYTKYVEIVTTPEYDSESTSLEYRVRYIRRPKPIIIGDLDGLTINGYKFTDQSYPNDALETEGCELDPMLHEEILQRAVELAKIAWTNTGLENIEAVINSGQRSE